MPSSRNGDKDDAEDSFSFKFMIEDSAKEGTYTGTITAEYDGKFADEESIQLTVRDCDDVVIDDEEDEEEEDEPTVIIQPPEDEEEKEPKKVPFTQTSTYIQLLVIVTIILVGLLILLIGALIFSK